MEFYEVFERVVVENGALLYRPCSHEALALAPPPNDRFVRRLQELGITPLSVGRTIIATGCSPRFTIVCASAVNSGLVAWRRARQCRSA